MRNGGKSSGGGERTAASKLEKAEVNKPSEVADIALTVSEQSGRKVPSLPQGRPDRTVDGSHCLDLICGLLFTGKQILPKCDPAASVLMICFCAHAPLHLSAFFSVSLFNTPPACPLSLLLSLHCTFHFAHFFFGLFAHTVNSYWLKTEASGLQCDRYNQVWKNSFSL